MTSYLIVQGYMQKNRITIPQVQIAALVSYRTLLIYNKYTNSFSTSQEIFHNAFLISTLTPQTSALSPRRINNIEI